MARLARLLCLGVVACTLARCGMCPRLRYHKNETKRVVSSFPPPKGGRRIEKWARGREEIKTTTAQHYPRLGFFTALDRTRDTPTVRQVTADSDPANQTPPYPTDTVEDVAIYILLPPIFSHKIFKALTLHSQPCYPIPLLFLFHINLFTAIACVNQFILQKSQWLPTALPTPSQSPTRRSVSPAATPPCCNNPHTDSPADVGEVSGRVRP